MQIIDGTILLWQKAELVESDEDLSVESWKVISSLRYVLLSQLFGKLSKILLFKSGSTSDIYDLAWSPDAQFIISACLDNTARVFSIAERERFTFH